MITAEKITINPFTGDEDAFKTDTVREEYEALCRDHDEIIKFGASYSSFDPLGKLLYIEGIEQIKERWDISFARFSLLGQINQKFVSQCNNFLQSMNLSEKDFKSLLKLSHDIMKEDAEQERIMNF